MIKQKLISFNIDEAVLEKVPGARELLAKGDQLAARDLEEFGLAMGGAFLEKALANGLAARVLNEQYIVAKPWQFKTEGNIYCTAASDGQKVYFGSDDGRFYAFDLKSGEKAWDFPVGAGVDSNPCVVDGVVYFGSRDTSVYMLGTADGSRHGSFAARGEVRCGPAVENGVIYVGSGDGHFYAHRIGPLTQKWEYETERSVRHDAVLYEDVVCFTDSNGYLYVVKKSSGMVRNKIRCNAYHSGPTIDRNRKLLYLGTFDGDFMALPLSTLTRENTVATPRWKVKLGKGEIANSTVAGELVYVGSRHDHTLFALDAETGEVVWKFRTKGWIRSKPQVKDGVVYFGSDDNRVYALDAKTGDLKWFYQTGGEVRSGVLVTDEAVLVGSFDHHFYALDRETGRDGEGCVVSRTALDQCRRMRRGRAKEESQARFILAVSKAQVRSASLRPWQRRIRAFFMFLPLGLQWGREHTPLMLGEPHPVSVAGSVEFLDKVFPNEKGVAKLLRKYRERGNA